MRKQTPTDLPIVNLFLNIIFFKLYNIYINFNINITQHKAENLHISGKTETDCHSDMNCCSCNIFLTKCMKNDFIEIHAVLPLTAGHMFPV